MIGIIIPFSALGADYNFFSKSISGQCKLANKLILKKTYLGFIRNKQSCDGSFAKKLLSSCNAINCESLISIYEEAQNRDSGNVIGGSL